MHTFEKKMKILITGGAGFIGSNFVCAALNLGHEVINVDKLTYAGKLSNLDGLCDNSNHHFYKQDICNRSEMEAIIFKHKPDCIIHMAAESHVDRSIDNADEFVQTNVNGTYSLLVASLKYYRQLKNQNNFRFLHLSTDEVFGSLGSVGKFNETMPYRPNSPYAASKASSDLLVRSYYKTYGFPAIIVNSSNNYGPKQYPEKLIPLTILNALEQKPLPIYGDGNQIRDWLFVESHVSALFSLISGGQIGESYCIGAENEISNIEIVKKICEILDDIKPEKKPYRDLITFVSDRPGHDYRYATDASKLKDHTGWKSNNSFSESLLKTIIWYINKFESLKENNNARVRIGLGQVL
jgi:dTDP-glucose 4,6-dehydratase